LMILELFCQASPYLGNRICEFLKRKQAVAYGTGHPSSHLGPFRIKKI
jgi:hypothetical protein